MTLKVIRLSFPQSNSYGKNRVIINCVKPEIGCGKYPIKGGVGEKITVQANIFGDGRSEV